MTTTTTTITYNSENFIRGSYNGVSILVRASDGFFNARKLVEEINEKEGLRKTLQNIRKSPDFINYKIYLSSLYEFHTTELEYELKGNNDVKGFYLHPKLLHIICTKTSVKYLHITTEIMDSINARSQATGLSFDEISNEIIKEQHQIIQIQNQHINEQTEVINDQCVRSADNNCKKLFIYRDEAKLIKLSVNQFRPPKNIIKTFVFPSAMTIKQDIRKQFNLPQNYIITNDQLDDIIKFINDRSPK